MKPSAYRNKPKYCLRCGKPYSAEYSGKLQDEGPPYYVSYCAECVSKPERFREGIVFIHNEKEAKRIKAFQADGSPGPGVRWKPNRDWRYFPYGEVQCRRCGTSLDAYIVKEGGTICDGCAEAYYNDDWTHGSYSDD